MQEKIFSENRCIYAISNALDDRMMILSFDEIPLMNLKNVWSQECETFWWCTVQTHHKKCHYLSCELWRIRNVSALFLMSCTDHFGSGLDSKKTDVMYWITTLLPSCAYSWIYLTRDEYELSMRTNKNKMFSIHWRSKFFSNLARKICICICYDVVYTFLTWGRKLPAHK